MSMDPDKWERVKNATTELTAALIDASSDAEDAKGKEAILSWARALNDVGSAYGAQAMLAMFPEMVDPSLSN